MVYTQADIEQIIERTKRAEWMAMGYMLAQNICGSSGQYQMYLDNGIQQAMKIMPMQEGTKDMHRRQKLIIDGVTKWMSISSTQELVDMVASAVRAEEIPRQRESVRFGDYLAEWYEVYHRPKLRKGTASNYESMMRKHILLVLGNLPVNEIKAADVQAVMLTLKSASTARQVRDIIGMAIDAAIADELYTHPNPVRDKRIVMQRRRRSGKE